MFIHPKITIHWMQGFYNTKPWRHRIWEVTALPWGCAFCSMFSPSKTPFCVWTHTLTQFNIYLSTKDAHILLELHLLQRAITLFINLSFLLIQLKFSESFVSKYLKMSVTGSPNPRKRLQITCFIRPTVQNTKFFNLHIMNLRSCTMRYYFNDQSIT